MLLWLIGGVVLVIVGVGFWLTRPVSKCPECASKEVQEVSRETLGVRFFESYPGGSPAGMRLDTQMRYKVRYRCRACEHGWQKEITETR